MTSSPPAIKQSRSMTSLYHEGEDIPAKLYKDSDKHLAVFTSGGDSPGMNSAVRAVVRMGLYLGCRVYLIYEGYQGMVDGGDNICEATWDSVSDIIQKGGTIIGSARCMDFVKKEGQLKACENLLKHKINNLVCIGGDGSLTGADEFRREWPSLVKELVGAGRVNSSDAFSNINIVGLVGSIDNDFCGTDMTIGTDTALHRIIEAIDAVTSTAQSHQRVFVVEVMGRHCGYLALVAALASEADWVFIPEWPSPVQWPDRLCHKLASERASAQRLNIICVAEGAIDCNGKPITCEEVKNVVHTKLGYDTRVTVLGHVQRGGRPSAFDRLLGCRMGAEAVLTLTEMNEEDEPCVISIDGNQMVRVPLMQCVQRTKQVAKAMKERNYDLAVKLRGRSFQRNLDTYKLLTKMRTQTDNSLPTKFNFAVMNVGAPAGGMNAAVRSFVRLGLRHNCNVYGIYNSFKGLLYDQIRLFTWRDVQNWSATGGSFLGTQKQIATAVVERVAEKLAKYKIHALLIIGGFEAYTAAQLLAGKRAKLTSLCIPICVIPATISNNIPGTSLTLGCDTALNEISHMIDTIKQSATGTKRRVFIIETMGGYCGYLATLSALTTGADNAYIFEEKFNVLDMHKDVKRIASKMTGNVQRYLVVRNENANANYTTQFVQQLFAEEGKGQFSTRVNVLGHAQQGGAPSPFDRLMGTRLGARALEHLLAQATKNYNYAEKRVITKGPETVTLIGLQSRQVVFAPVEELAKETDYEHRLPKEQWWLKLRPLLRILAKHDDSIYTTDALPANIN